MLRAGSTLLQLVLLRSSSSSELLLQQTSGACRLALQESKLTLPSAGQKAKLSLQVPDTAVTVRSSLQQLQYPLPYHSAVTQTKTGWLACSALAQHTHLASRGGTLGEVPATTQGKQSYVVSKAAGRLHSTILTLRQYASDAGANQEVATEAQVLRNCD